MIDPVTACQALTLGRELIGLLQGKPSGTTSEKPFGTLLSNQVQGAQPVSAPPTVMSRVEELAQQLLQNPALRSAAVPNGFSVALLPDNSALVRAEDGSQWTIGAGDSTVRGLREAVAQMRLGQPGAAPAEGVMALRVSASGRAAILG
jgi:hypothetical protein